jgi:hypothetical protein
MYACDKVPSCSAVCVFELLNTYSKPLHNTLISCDAVPTSQSKSFGGDGTQWNILSQQSRAKCSVDPILPALGSSPPLIYMDARNLPADRGWPGRKADLTNIYEPTAETRSPHRPVTQTVLLLTTWPVGKP